MEQKDNSGVLFKNDKKQKESHPDYQGKCVVDGVEKYISAWVAESKDGKKYFKMTFKDVVR